MSMLKVWEFCKFLYRGTMATFLSYVWAHSSNFLQEIYHKINKLNILLKFAWGSIHMGPWNCMYIARTAVYVYLYWKYLKTIKSYSCSSSIVGSQGGPISWYWVVAKKFENSWTKANSQCRVCMHIYELS